MDKSDFSRFAYSEKRISPMTLHRYGNAVNAYINPTIIEERRMNVAQMDVMSRLLCDRILFLGVPIDPDVANIVNAQLLFLASTDDKADITMYINTPGGSVIDGLSIMDTMLLVKPDIATVCTGLAASMGSILLSSGTKGKRSTLPHSRVMIHQPLGGVSGQASDILIEAKEIEKCREELYRILAENTGQSYEKIFEDSDRNFWMSPKEAMAYGIIDTIIGQPDKNN